MANRYWVGGTGTWDGSDTSHWSASSGGASGASVPDATMDVIFDQAGSYTVTRSGSPVQSCKSFTVSAGSPTFVGSNLLAVYGSFTLNATTNWTSGPPTSMSATSTGWTVNTAGVTLYTQLNFVGVGGAWTLQGDVTMWFAGAFTHTAGTLDLNGYNVTCGNLNCSGSTARTLIMGTGTFTTTWGSFTVSGSNVTFSGASASVVAGGPAGGYDAVGQTVGSLYINNINFSLAAGTITTLTHAPATWGNVTQTLRVMNSATIGTFVCAGVDAQKPLVIVSSTFGTARTLTIGTWASAAHVYFQDITIAGAVAPVTVTGGGDCGGNSGITFPSAKTVYWNHASNTGWHSTSWATTSTGSPAIANQPLPQDTARFGAGGSHAATLNMNSVKVGSIDFTGVGAITVTWDGITECYGSVTLASNVTLAGSTFTNYFSGRSGTQTIISAGKTWLSNLEFRGGSTKALGDAFTMSSDKQLTLNGTTLTTNNFNMNVGKIATSSALGGSVMNGGSSVISLSGTGGYLFDNGPNLTFNAGTSKLKITCATASSSFSVLLGSVSGNGIYDLELAMTGAGCTVSLMGSGVVPINALTSTLTAAATVKLQSGQTFAVTSFGLTGSSGNVVALTSTTNPTTATLQRLGPWNVGANSTIGTGTTGMTAAAGLGVDYLNATYITAVNTTPGKGNLFFGSNF